MAKISQLAEAQEAESAGVTAQKRTARQEMADLAFTVGGTLQAYGDVSGNADLVANSKVTRTDLIYGRDTAAAPIARNIHTLATEHLAALADYDVTPAMVTELDEKITAYENLLQRPRAVIVTRAAATAQLAAAFAAADDVLEKRMDPLSLAFRVSEPAFYLAYTGAREIVDN